MPKFTPKVLTANALASGEVIWRRPDGGWSPDHRDAQLLEDEAEAAALLEDAASDIGLVGPYLADAAPGVDGPRPVHLREAFRTRGPSNHAHGKQEAVTDA